MKSIGKGIYSGAINGIAIGSVVGLLGGLKGAKRGSIVGAALGSIFGGFISKRMTSNKTVDILNELNKKKYDRNKKIIENPTPYLKGIYGSKTKIDILNRLEKTYGIKFPREYYKFLKVQERFIPVIAKWMKDNEEPFIPGVILVSSVNEEEYLEPDLEESYIDTYIMLINPEMSDDTWITWSRSTGKWGYSPYSKGNNFNTLKEALINYLSKELEFYLDYYEKKDYKYELVDKYRDFIKQNL